MRAGGWGHLGGQAPSIHHSALGRRTRARSAVPTDKARRAKHIHTYIRIYVHTLKTRAVARESILVFLFTWNGAGVGRGQGGGRRW